MISHQNLLKKIWRSLFSYRQCPWCCRRPRGRFRLALWTDSQLGLRDDPPSLPGWWWKLRPSGEALREEENRKERNVEMICPQQSNSCVCVCVCLCFTFLLVFVDIHLSLLLEAKRVDDCNGQSQGFPGVTVGTQGVDASACRRDVVCVVDRKRKSFAIHSHRHAVSYKLWGIGCS